MNILVVEDEPQMADLLARGLREETYEVSVAKDGGAALRLATETDFDLVLLDVMLPGTDGFQVARELRRLQVQAPVLMLTARDSVPDVVRGLDSGADDYVTKPFSFVELLARVRALARRGASRRKNVLEIEDIVLDTISRRAFRGGTELDLSVTEYRLLELLMTHQGRVVPRHIILESVWGNRDVSDNTLDAFVRLLRKKVDEGAAIRLIQTHRGFGYSIGRSETVWH